MTISLATFVKNEESCIWNMIHSVQDYVDEVILVDTGSTDATVSLAKEICASRKIPLPITVYNIGFTDFGSIRTVTSHLATKDWVLMLDADESLSNPELLNHLVSLDEEAFAFPRRRWLDHEMKKQTELEAYPDWQVRFYKNNKSFIWERQLHEYFHGGRVTHVNEGPIIEHFHDVYKTPAQLAIRLDQYKSLANIAGVALEGGHVI